MTFGYDVYVWVDDPDRAGVLRRFIDRHVDRARTSDPHLDAFVRVLVEGRPRPGDQESLQELALDPWSSSALSLYVASRDHQGAIVTVTEEGRLVLGLTLADPTGDSPEVAHEAVELLAALMTEFTAAAGIAGVELAPPRSAEEWRDDAMVQHRVGTV